MDGPPRYNPSRRSRFRPQPPASLPQFSPVPADPAEPVDAPPAAEEYDAVAESAAPAEWPASEYGDETTAHASVAPEYATPEIWPAEAYHPAPDADPTGFAPPAPAAGPVTNDEELPPAFQLRKVYDGAAPPPAGLKPLYATLLGIALLSLGIAGGYWYGIRNVPQRAVRSLAMTPLADKSAVTQALSAQTQAAVDAAFDATKQRHYDDAQKQFAALYKEHPEWPSMGIESARATLYQFDAQATGRILTDVTRTGPLPDADFLKALMRLTHKEFDQADVAFAAAVALDPARPDFYYFWGESLRTQGKPREAGEKFQAALLRNQYETAEDLYQLKLWLSQIQADQEETSGANAKINAGLAMTPRPPYSAVFAAAGREIKAGRFAEAAKYVAQAQQLTEPVVYRVILQDPTFAQESWRPELAPFYK